MIDTGHRTLDDPEPFSDASRRLFGRRQETADLFERWSVIPFTVLCGAAGAGKTALIAETAARLVESSGSRGRLVLGAGTITPAGGPSQTRRNPFVQRLVETWAPARGKLPCDRSALSISESLHRLRPLDRPAIFAVVDQLESLFHDPRNNGHAAEFIEQLVDAVRTVPALHVLVAVREEYLPELSALEHGLGRPNRYRLGPLRAEAAFEAVVGQLKGTGWEFERKAAEEVVTNLRTSQLVDVLGERREVVADTVEPAQLRAACSALIRALPAGSRTISLDHLYGEGDLDGALVAFCDRAVREVAQAFGLQERDLAAWLAGTFITDRGTRGTAYEGVADVAGMPHGVVGGLVDRHVLSARWHLGSRWFQLPNDRLVAAVRENANRYPAGSTARGEPAAASSLAAAEDALAEGNLVLAAQRASEAARTSGEDNLRVHACALSCLGRVAARGGYDQRAESYYEAAAELFEVMQDRASSGRLLAERGRILRRRGRYVEAVALLQRADARLPSDVYVRIELARALRAAGQLLAATAVLGAALTVAPGTVEALVERGLIYAERGEHSCALGDLDLAIRLRPSIASHSEIRSARQAARAGLDVKARDG